LLALHDKSIRGDKRLFAGTFTRAGSGVIDSICDIGLAVGSGNTTTLNTSEFSNVGVTP
jgi:hypothetical protein